MSDTDDPTAGGTARNAAMLAVSELVGKVGTLAYTVLAARALTTEAYGAFAYAVSVALILQSLPTWGFDTYLVQKASADRSRLQQLVSRSLSGKLLLMIPAFLLGGVAVSIGRPSGEAVLALWLVIAATALDTVGDTGRNAATASQRLVGISIALSVNRLVTAGLAVLAIVLGGGLVGIAAAYLVGSLGGLVVTAIAVARLGVRLRPERPRLRLIWSLMKDSWAIGVLGLFGLLLFRVDAVLLELLQGDDAVGVYAVAYRLVETVMFIAWAAARAIFPVMSADTRGDRLRSLTEQAVGTVAVFYLPFAAIALVEGGSVIDLLFGDGYGAASTAALAWLAPAPLLFAVGYLANHVLLSVERSRTSLVITVGVTVLNATLNLALIPSMSASGAAIATSVSYLAQAIVIVIVLRPITGIIRLHRGIPAPLIASGALAAVLVAVDLPVLLELPIAGVAYAVVYVLAARLLAPEQLRVVRSILPG